MKKFTIMMVAIALLSGCGMWAHTTRDLSTTEETALIGGFNTFSYDCSFYAPLPIKEEYTAGDAIGGIFGEFFGVTESTSRYVDSLVVDAGPVKIRTSCTYSNPFGSSTKSARFSFVAEAGHTYTVSWEASDCLNLLDVTNEGHVIACEPFYSGSYKDLSTGDNTAIIKAGGASRNKGDCSPTTGGRRERRDNLKVDAGPITINGMCQAAILPDFFGRRRRVSNFEFIAEAGHTYTITATDKECMTLLDITSEETVIACEPYKKAE